MISRLLLYMRPLDLDEAEETGEPYEAERLVLDWAEPGESWGNRERDITGDVVRWQQHYNPEGMDTATVTYWDGDFQRTLETDEVAWIITS